MRYHVHGTLAAEDEGERLEEIGATLTLQALDDANAQARVWEILAPLYDKGWRFDVAEIEEAD